MSEGAAGSVRIHDVGSDARRRLLVVAPFPTHPPTAGNRARLRRLLAELAGIGFEIHFLLAEREGGGAHAGGRGDLRAMRAEWTQVHPCPPGRLGDLADRLDVPGSPRGPSRAALARGLRTLEAGVHRLGDAPDAVLAELGGTLRSRAPRVYRAWKPWFPDLAWSGAALHRRWSRAARRAPPIDSRYDFRLDRALARLERRWRYEALLVEGVVLSRALGAVPPHVIRILDALDVIAGRRERLAERGITDRTFAAGEEDESEGLARAERILAIGADDAETLRRRVSVEVDVVGHVVELGAPRAAAGGRERLLFVGAANPENVDAVRRFAAEVLPIVRRARPAVTLALAGRISSAVEAPGIESLGAVDDLSSVYEAAALAVNPARAGTGLSIKTIEALGAGLPVVASEVGCRGLDPSLRAAVAVAESPETSAREILRLLEDDALHHARSAAGVDAAEASNRRAREALRHAFRPRSAPPDR